MRCPYCAYPESKVIDSRPTDENNSIRRRRECLSCGKRFTTYEKVESLPIVVIKKDKTRELFNREKLLAGLNIPVFNVPDIVLSLNYSEHSTEQNGVLFCLRHDKEKVSDDKAINRIQSLCKQNGYSLKLTDTVVNHDVEEDNVKKECENKICCIDVGIKLPQ